MGDIRSFGPDDFVATNNMQQQAYCDQYNREAEARYRQGVANYNLFVEQVGKVPPFAPPSLPTKWVLTAPDQHGLRWQTTSNIPVCDPLPLKTPVTEPTRAANVISVGKRIHGEWFQVGAGDGFAVGQKTPPTTSADGVVGVFEKYGAAVGAGWYLRVG